MSKKKGRVVQFQPISLERYIKEKARGLEFGKCFIVGDESDFLLHAVVTRVKKNGKIIACYYLVDIGCLGVKDSFYREFENYEEILDVFNRNLSFGELSYREISTDYIQNLIYGAVEWAEDAGFQPEKNFKTTEYMLDEVESVPYIEIPFGKDGKYFYVQGTMEDPNRVLKTLTENVGEDNFEFISEFSIFYGDDDDFEDDD